MLFLRGRVWSSWWSFFEYSNYFRASLSHAMGWRSDDYRRVDDGSHENTFLWYCVVGFLFVSIAGSMFHFTYQWTHCNWFVGFFVAVNESVFEHVKILIFPIFLFWFVDCLCFGDVMGHVAGVTVAIYSGTAFLVVVYLAVFLIFNFEQLWFDILLFCVSALVAQIAGWCLANRLSHSDYFFFGLVAPAAMLAVVCFLIFTDIPPHVPLIFEDPGGFYGRPETCHALDFPSFK